MPKIIQNQDQIKALEDISNLLEEIKVINRLLSVNGASFYIVEKTLGKDSKTKTYPSVMVSEEMEDGVRQLLMKHKKSIALKIKKLSKAYKIELSEEESEMLVIQGE